MVRRTQSCDDRHTPTLLPFTTLSPSAAASPDSAAPYDKTVTRERPVFSGHRPRVTEGVTTEARECAVIVTLEQSIRIYARATRTWFGDKACQKTQERIDQLARAGDLDGAEVHHRVKQHIIELNKQDVPAPKRMAVG